LVEFGLQPAEFLELPELALSEAGLEHQERMECLGLWLLRVLRLLTLVRLA
jgi:hypothetical protein